MIIIKDVNTVVFTFVSPNKIFERFQNKIMLFSVFVILFYGRTISAGLLEGRCTDPWSQQVDQLRSLFEKNGIEGYIIPSEDSHLSEYVAPEYARREFISGLKGSAGEAVVLNEKAAIKSDSRYCEAIDAHVDCNWETYCPGRALVFLLIITVT